MLEWRTGTADPAGGFNAYPLDETARVYRSARGRDGVAAGDAGAGRAGGRVSEQPLLKLHRADVACSPPRLK